MFFYGIGNARNSFKNEDETTLNVYAPCLHLTGLAPLCGIVIPILLIWCDVITCSTVHDFSFSNLARRTLGQSKNWEATVNIHCNIMG